MRCPRIALFASLILTAVDAGAQSPARNVFAPLEFAVGSCLTGPFPGGKAVDEHCFEWVYDRKFIRDKHIVRNTSSRRA